MSPSANYGLYMLYRLYCFDSHLKNYEGDFIIPLIDEEAKDIKCNEIILYHSANKIVNLGSKDRFF